MFYMFAGPDFLYAERVLFEGHDLCAERAGAGRVGARPDAIAARRRRLCALQRRALAGLDPELQLLHHQADEDRSAAPARSAAPCRSSMCSWRARARPSGASVRSRSTTRARRISPTKIPGRTRCAARASSSPAATAQEKTLYYFSTDLSNSGVKASGFLKFCATLAPGNSLIKSASYLLHSGNFTTVRDFLLANSATIIQDDSGIPLAYYSPKKWRFFPFGRYVGPIGEFPGTLPANPTPNCSGARSRWISASAIAGARMNRICCCR